MSQPSQDRLPWLRLLGGMVLLCSWHAQGLLAQLPVLKGFSATQSGMLYYDYSTAADQRDRIYEYTICPDSAACILLDFNLVEALQGANTEAQDFIQVWEGSDKSGRLLGTLGKKSGSILLQGMQSCLTLEFRRDHLARKSIWTATWQAQPTSVCIAPQAISPCASVQDICGPNYHENFPYYGPTKQQGLESLQGTCLDKPHNSHWYRFMAQRAGQLSFDILPDNGFDDFDWVLLKGDAQHPEECPDLSKAEQKLACNFSMGRAAGGATGMGERGETVAASAIDCPYSSAIQVEKGDVFYLLIDDYSQHSSGFDLRFNDVVMPCENVKKDLLHIDQVDALGKPPIDPRRTFSQHTAVLRVALEEKANRHLGMTALPANLFSGEKDEKGKLIQNLPQLGAFQGLPQVLIQGLKMGRLQAYSAEDFRTQLHFGDLLTLVWRASAGSAGRVDSSSWWNPPVEGFLNFETAIDLIVDESFDKNTGRAKREIRYLRLLWIDPAPNVPDYNVAVFKFEDVVKLLDKVLCGNSQNDVTTRSMRDAMIQGDYQSILIGQSGKKVSNLTQSKAEESLKVELQNYLWTK